MTNYKVTGTSFFHESDWTVEETNLPITLEAVMDEDTQTAYAVHFDKEVAYEQLRALRDNALAIMFNLCEG